MNSDQTTAALSALVPALAAGFQRNLKSEGGLGSLMSALSSGSQNRDGSILDDVTSMIGRFMKPS